MGMPAPDRPQGGAELGAPYNNGTIPDDDSVYRRLSDSSPNMVSEDSLTGERRPSSGAFMPDDDGVSVYRESKLQEAGLGAADVVRSPLNLVVSIEVGDVRSVPPLGVWDDPWPQGIDEPEHPRNAAHALIVGWEGLSRNQSRERQRALTKLPSLRFIYP